MASLGIIDRWVEPSGEVGAPCDHHFESEGGVPPYEWSLVSGKLPPGLTLEKIGLLAGTPTQAGSFPGYIVQVKDSTGTIATKNFEEIQVKPSRYPGPFTEPPHG